MAGDVRSVPSAERPDQPAGSIPGARDVAWATVRAPLLLRDRLWALALIGAIAVSVVFVMLGTWQHDRHLQKVARRDAVQANYTAPVAALPQVLSGPDRTLPRSAEWQPVRLGGTYLPDGTRLVRNRELDGRIGYEVLVPLRTDTGEVLVVDRGWLPAGSTARAPDAVPAPPAGVVQVVVRLRPPEPGTSRRAPAGQVLRIRPEQIGAGLGGRIHAAYGVLASESPRPETAPVLLPRPDVGLGPHLAYAVQWWGFAVIVHVLWWVGAVRETRRRRPR